MYIRFLGTAAAEGLPSPYCTCSTCTHARTHQGKNIRKRTAYMINDDLLVDVGPDLFPACAQLGLTLTNIEYILVSHSHSDHFDVNNLNFRASGFRQGNELPTATLVGPPSALALLNSSGASDAKMAFKRVPFLPFDHLHLPPYRIESVKANHQLRAGDAMNYMIDDGKTRILIASDTGIYDEDVWERLRNRNFQLVIMEGTMGTRKSNGNNHLSIDNMRTMINRLKQINAITNKTLIYGTHFSHQSVPPHDELEQILQKIGVHTAYDGLVIEC